MFIIVSFMSCLKAQVVDDTMHVLYAKPADRISLRVNTVDWLLQTPSVGLEYNVRKENWNRWAVGVNVRGRWKGSNTFKPGLVYNLNEIRVEFKNYWRERFVRGEGSHALDGNTDPHTSYFDKLFSLRRKNVYNPDDPKHSYPYLKHPSIVFFRGIYGSYDKYSIKFGKTGYQGDAFSIGGTYGIIKTLHEYQRGGRLDLEFGVSAGWIYLYKCQEYSLNRSTNTYVQGKVDDGKFIPFPVLTDIRVGFLYRFGKMPLHQQYRWRYDADSAFHALVDSIAADRQAKWEQKQIDKSYAKYITPVKTVIADARKTLNSWPDSIYSYMVLQRAIEQAERDSSEILQPVYVNKSIVYDSDGAQKIEIIQRELEYYKSRAESYVEADRRARFVADSLYKDSVQKVLDDSLAVVNRAKFVADSLYKDSVSTAKRAKFLNDSIYKDSVKRYKAALKDSLKEAKARMAEINDSLKAAAEELTGEEAPVTDENTEELTPVDENAEPTENAENSESAENAEATEANEGEQPTENAEDNSSDESAQENAAEDSPQEADNGGAEQQNDEPQQQEANNESEPGNDESEQTDNSQEDNANNESAQEETKSEDENGNADDSANDESNSEEE